MHKFDNVYNKIMEQIIQIIPRPQNSSSIQPLPQYIIYEDCAFHKLPRKFADFIIIEFKKLKENYQNTKKIEKEIDIRSILNLIEKSEVENFQEFFDFIQILKNSKSEKILTLQLSIENSYTEPPSLEEFKTVEYKEMFHDKENAPYSYKLAKKIYNKQYSESLKLMKQYVDAIDDLGIIKIKPDEINNKIYEFDSDDTEIGHEIRHFLIFLQRWSKTNYEICRTYSNQNLDKLDPEDAFKIYQLNENEFITLSSTYIERMLNIFNKYKRNEVNQRDDFNLFIKSILFLANDENVDNYWTNIFNKLLNSSMKDDKDETLKIQYITQKLKIKAIIDFFKNILNDHKYKFENNIQNKKDKFITLIKWCLKTYDEKFDEEINE